MKLEVINRITFSSSDPNDVIYYGQLLLDEAKSRNNDNYVIKAFRGLGLGFRKKGELEVSLKFFFQAAQLSNELDNQYELAVTLTEIATTYIQNKDSKNALRYDSKAIEVHRKIGNKKNLAISLLNTG
ncbi:MAG: tetratricopeptide repeat protein, partial [Bacteroidota bacterium]